MKPINPYMRYVGIVFIACLLALAFVKAAQAAEPNPECVEALAPYAGAVYGRHRAGVSPELNALLIRSDPDLSGQGRWVLLRFLDVAVARPDVHPAEILGALCALPNIPTAAPVYRSEFDRPKDI